MGHAGRAVALAALVMTCACSARGVNGEASDDRIAAQLRSAAQLTLTAAFRFSATESKDSTDLPAIDGSFSPPDTLSPNPAPPGAVPAAANPKLLLTDIAATRYVTQSSGSLRFNLPAANLDALVGGAAADDDDFTGEAFLNSGRVARVRFQATRKGVHYLGDVHIAG